MFSQSLNEAFIDIYPDPLGIAGNRCVPGIVPGWSRGKFSH